MPHYLKEKKKKGDIHYLKIEASFMPYYLKEKKS